MKHTLLAILIALTTAGAADAAISVNVNGRVYQCADGQPADPGPQPPPSPPYVVSTFRACNSTLQCYVLNQKAIMSNGTTKDLGQVAIYCGENARQECLTAVANN